MKSCKCSKTEIQRNPQKKTKKMKKVKLEAVATIRKT